MATAKKPTAKQLAARAKFAAMAKSGALARKRGNTKKTKRNPAPKPAAKAVQRAAPQARFMNPRDSLPYKVHKVGAQNRPGELVGAFRTRAIAVSFAEGYATLHKCPVLVVGD